MYEIAALLLIVLSSIVVVRAGAVALTMTGLSMDMARFQALSAFTGTGFTTKESESIVGHPARRSIIQVLMLLGNAGLFSALAALIVSFSQSGGESLLLRFGLMIAGLLGLLLLSKIGFLNRMLNFVLQKIFERLPLLNIRDYEALLRVDKGYAISHVTVDPGTWLAGKTLRECALSAEGVLVLSIDRSTGSVLGTPGPKTTLKQGDQLLLYGQEEDLADLALRPDDRAGEEAHDLAVEKQRLRRAHESADDRS
ncbi:MAG: TrkA C-terminal domain-containing protein [Planctomycetes bacterium]|nr:TrkA C-terminal domain-containing protein [Planctomycetota bacterium]